jgi:hypothetical protein
MSIAIGMRSWEATSAHWRQRRRDVSESMTTGMAAVTCRRLELRPVRLVHQPPASSTFLSQQTSHQQPASSTFLSEQTSTSHQPPGN